MTIAGKISLGGSVALSLATAAMALMIMNSKGRFIGQLRAVEENLRSPKFVSQGLNYTADFIRDEAEPAATIKRAGEGWETTGNEMKTAKAAEDKAKTDLVEAKAKNQELSLKAEKLGKDLEAAKSDLDSTNSKLKVTAEELQSFTDELKGRKPDELYREINDLSEKFKVAESENRMLAVAKEKTESELKKLREVVDAGKPGATKAISLTGRILAVNPTWNFVILDLGKKDQMVEGLTLVIYRGETMIGKVKTVTVDFQTSVADVLPGTPATAIEVGDQVVY